MSHHVEIVDGVAKMAYAGETPWHGLGTPVDSTLSAAEMQVAAGLDYTVSKRKLYYAGAKADSKRVIKDRFAIVRDSDDQFYSLCSPKYNILQPADVFGFFHKFVDAGHMKMHTAGSLLSGKFIWALAEVGDEFKVGREDVVKGYLLMMSPYEMGRAALIQHTSTRVVCWNTLNMALGTGLKGKGAFRLPHTLVFDDDVKAKAEEALTLSHDHLRQFEEAANTLADVKVDAETTDAYFRRVFKLAPTDLAVRELADQATEVAAERGKRVIAKLEEALVSGPGAKLPGSAGTAWGALNAVTFVVDHQLGHDRDKVMRDNWLGYRGATKRRALEEALKLAA